ncbi:MAG: thioether cross-link-forming SCIFF peptide maturase [Clostridia bacterium]|nr:thioether cross-link-forming SCIFF peptide maturase [Clostridia bacterium]
MVHLYSMHGRSFALDVNSGAVLEVDKLTYDMLSLLEKHDDKNGGHDLREKLPDDVLDRLREQYELKDIETARNEVSELINSEMLYTPDVYEDIAKKSGELAPVKALCLHVAHDCNLRCEYCFASTGDFGGTRKLMDLETGKKAIDLVILKSRGRRNIEIDFFGGEPLMNFGVVKKITEYASEQGRLHNKNFRFTITTNGVLLNDENMEYINEHMSNVVLSLDGRKEVNDRVRKTASGGGSYDVIAPKLLKMAKLRGDREYYVRGTFTKYNKDFSNDVLHLADAGFDQISVEPVVSDPKLAYSLTEDDLPQIYEEYERLAKIMYDRICAGEGFNFFHFMLDLTQGPCVIKRLHGCGSGNEYLAVTPEGDIYPCHQFVGHSEYKMGNVHESDELDLTIKKTFAENNVYSKPECKKCWAKFYCSGGCAANNFQMRGDIKLPNTIACELEKKRVECAIWLAAALNDREEN